MVVKSCMMSGAVFVNDSTDIWNMKVCVVGLDTYHRGHPRYLVEFLIGIAVCYVKANVMCEDLHLLALIFHFRSHSPMRLRCYRKSNEATVGSSLVEKITVFSANVQIVVSLAVGIPEV